MQMDIQLTRMTRHATNRQQQRAIHRSDIRVALTYGRRRWHHGDHVYTLTDRALRNTPFATQASRLRGLCVVVTVDHAVRTVKWDYECAKRPGVLRGRYHREALLD